MPAADIAIRLMSATETAQLQDLLQRCYGDSYYDALYYDRQALAQAIASEDQYSIVAVNPAGQFVAHIGLRNHRGSRTADTSMAIVDPRYRSRGLFVDVGAALLPIYEKLELCGLYLQAVTVHPFTQQSSLKGGGAITGIYLNYTPAFTRFLEIDAPPCETPTPAVIIVQPLSPPPIRPVIWPTRYKTQLQQALHQCGMSRKAVTPQALEQQSSIRLIKKPRQNVCYLWVDKVGENLSAQLANLLDDLDQTGFDVSYLQLPLDTCNLDTSIDAVRALGFCYAGAMPEYGQRDWLTLQRLDRSALDTSTIHLINEQGRDLLAFILDD